MTRHTQGRANEQVALPHFGALLQRVRSVRGLSPAELTAFCGFQYQTTVERLESGRLPRDGEIVRRYLAALAAPELLSSALALTPQQVALLAAIYQTQTRRRRLESEAALAALSLRTILPDTRPPALEALVRQLEATPYPALIMDDLWFDHAINGSLCNMFAIPRLRVAGSSRLQLPPSFYERWEMWHSVAIKFPRESPLRVGYETTDRYFLPVVLQVFFEDPCLYPHLFGGHLRLLLERLHRVAPDEGYSSFVRAWHQTTALLVPETARELLRIITYQGQSLPFRVRIAARVPVTVTGGYTVHYALAIWEPDSAQSAQTAHAVADHSLYFAADHDLHNHFHINDWPELSTTLAVGA